MPRLLHVYSPSGRDGEVQAETWAALAAIEPVLLAEGWSVEHIATGPGDDYERALRERWGLRDDLILLEHDIVPTLEMLRGLAACSDELCAQAYRLHFASDTGKAVDALLDMLPIMDAKGRQILAERGLGPEMLRAYADGRREDMNGTCWEPFCHRVREREDIRWGHIGDERAAYVGFGLTKIGAAFRERHPVGWAAGAWSDLDGRVCNWVLGLGRDWHVHWPEVPHRHPHCSGYWVGDPIGIGKQVYGARPSRWSGRLPQPAAQQVPSEIEAALAMLRQDPPRVVLEIGSAEGGSLAAWAAVAAEDALLVSVDASILPAIPHGPQQTLMAVQGNSHDPDTLAKVTEILRGRPVDWLFIDGDHSLEGVRADFEAFAPLVRPGGRVGLHDIVPHPDRSLSRVDEFWSGIRHHFPHREFIADPAQGWAGIGVLYLPSLEAAGAAMEA